MKKIRKPFGRSAILNPNPSDLIILSDSETDNEQGGLKKPITSHQTPKLSSFRDSRIEIDLTADESPPLVTTSRGTPLIASSKKNHMFAENHSFIDYYFPSSSSSSASPLLDHRKRKNQGKMI
jgi:hypothetical protein